MYAVAAFLRERKSTTFGLVTFWQNRVIVVNVNKDRTGGDCLSWLAKHSTVCAWLQEDCFESPTILYRKTRVDSFLFSVVKRLNKWV